jgi:hypothetical protein
MRTNTIGILLTAALFISAHKKSVEHRFLFSTQTPNTQLIIDGEVSDKLLNSLDAPTCGAQQSFEMKLSEGVHQVELIELTGKPLIKGEIKVFAKNNKIVNGKGIIKSSIQEKCNRCWVLLEAIR